LQGGGLVRCSGAFFREKAPCVSKTLEGLVGGLSASLLAAWQAAPVPGFLGVEQRFDYEHFEDASREFESPMGRQYISEIIVSA
jgi:hypothetical protein